ncbi:ABC transporter ATP-binding protein [Paenibacillus hamazuiensis]|uniref:ABC transporter ATP-binding protein n=1 Tax=Paenibacillus hamazuiensis TaxID=2936508 RepID=UPI00200C0E4B|nr:ABC transporter ATP-binding protein [Paenibacillus hamazuiensis]
MNITARDGGHPAQHGDGQADNVPALRMRGVFQKKESFQLGPLDLEIPSGYVTAIVGHNGSGKSTLFRLALDQSKPDEGEIFLLGEAVGGRPDDAKLKRRIGYVADEDAYLERSIRGTERADFVSRWYPNWDRSEFERLTGVLEVDAAQRLGRMSKGGRRKYELALALAHHPELLLLDEPSSGLDPFSCKKMVEELHRYMEQGGRTIIMATHILEDVRRLADYIVCMADGRVIGMYEKDELLGSWHTFYAELAGARSSAVIASEAAEMPGVYSVEEAGGGTCRIVTSRAWEAEAWCKERGWTITGRRPLELDDIMEALIEKSRRK